MRVIIILIIVLLNFCNAQESIWYLIGKNYSGDSTSYIFSPGFISSSNQEHSALAFTPDGHEIYWSIWELPYSKEKTQAIKFSKFENGQWTAPQTVSFSGKYMDGSPVFSSDGDRIYFYSNRPVKDNRAEGKDINIWYVKRIKSGWSEPEYFDVVNTLDGSEAPGSFAENGNFYFVRGKRTGDNPIPKVDIYVAEFINGEYLKPVKINGAVNTFKHRENYPFVAPDESFIIYSSDQRKFSENGKYLSGNRYLFISFKKDGGWGAPVKFPTKINGEGARFPSVTPDGKFLIYTRYTEGANEDFYFISTRIIDSLKNNL